MAAVGSVSDASLLSGLWSRLARTSATPSWAFSLLFHVTFLLALACLIPPAKDFAPTSVALTMIMPSVDDSEVSFESIAEMEPDLSDVMGNPDPEQQHPSNAALEGEVPDMTSDSITEVDTAPDLMFAEDHVEAVPDSETLVAEVVVADLGRDGHGSSDGRDEIDGGALTSFFGVRASGRAVVYVVDCSSSMDGPPLERLKKELIDSIKELPESSRFAVIFFSSGAIHFGTRPHLLDASVDNKRRVIAWVEGIPALGGTDPADALAAALAMNPSVVFLMTDGNFTFPFDRQLMGRMADQNETRINTIAFGDQAATEPLKTIATITNGTFAQVGVAAP